MRRMLAFVTVAIGACSASVPPPAPPTQPEKKSSVMLLTNLGLGPLTKDTRVTLTSLREALAPEGLTVNPEYDTSLSFDAYRGTNKVFYVVGNDDGSMFYVHALSPQIRVEPHLGWVVTRPFYDDALLSFCDCWGKTTVCWRNGDNVAVGFARECTGLDSERGRRALEGVTIARVIWSPTPFKHDEQRYESEDSEDNKSSD